MVAKAKGQGIPAEFDPDYLWGTGSWEEEDDLLVVDCRDAGERGNLVEGYRKLPWVEFASVWAGGDPGYIQVISEALRSGEYIGGFSIGQRDIALLFDSEAVVAQIEQESIADQRLQD